MESSSSHYRINAFPSKLTKLVNKDVVYQHAGEAAFLWTMRTRAVLEPHYTLDDLAGLDERVEAHLDGLRIAEEEGWRQCLSNLENAGPGELFAASILAFGTGGHDRMIEAVQRGCSSQRLRPGLISALGWLEFATVSSWIARLLQARSPEHRAVGVAACAIHRRDPGTALDAAISDPDPLLRARALRAVGELKRHDLSNPVREQLKSEDETCRFWAAWALTMNGERSGLSELTRWFDRPDALGGRALQTGLRALHLDESRACVRALVQQPHLDRSAVIGVGVVGDPASIPWLIQKMESPSLARIAGEAFSMIAGVDLAAQNLRTRSTAA